MPALNIQAHHWLALSLITMLVEIRNATVAKQKISNADSR